MNRIIFGLISTVFLAFTISCSTNRSDNKSVDSTSVVVNKILADTLTQSFPIQIGNDSGTVNVVGIRKYLDDDLIGSSFLVSLDEIQDFSIEKKIDRKIVFESNETVHYLDTVNRDYINRAVIKDIVFEGVRSNTLSFRAILENRKDAKEIRGRFHLFYRTEKKGKIYGWFTNEVRKINPLDY